MGNESRTAAASPCAPLTEGLVRATGIEFRSDEEDGPPTLFGHFAVFNRWAEINSVFEGHFMERVAPGAFKKTFTEMREKIRVLFQHGTDPQFGRKPLGPITELHEDSRGAYYEVPLLDTPLIRGELLPRLEAGLLGASFQFDVVREEWNDDPKPTEGNPTGLPERTLKEVRTPEFGPVTFPAYADASAGVRSLTDHFIFDAMERNPERFRELFARAAAPAQDDAATGTATTSNTGLGFNVGNTVTVSPPHLVPPARRTAPAYLVNFKTREEWLRWISEN